MGHGWRRVMENVRQRVGADRAFRATSNARNEAMFKEATDFCTHLRLLERDLRAMHKEIEGKFLNLKGILLSPLPRPYEEGANGAVPCSEELKLIGQGVAVDGLTQAAAELKIRLEEEVIKPLRSWLGVYKTVSERMEKLEALRLELDSRRRSVDALGDKLERLHNTQPANPQAKDKLEAEMEKAAQLLQHKQDKLTRTGNAYRDMEQTVFNSLHTLIKDTGVLRDYTGLSLQLMQDCYQRGSSAFSSATPLHDYNSTSDPMFAAVPPPPPPSHYAPSSAHRAAIAPHGMLDKAQSERALMVRQLSERPGNPGGAAPGAPAPPGPGRLGAAGLKDAPLGAGSGRSGAAMYAESAAEDGSDASNPYALDQTAVHPGLAGHHHHNNQQQPPHNFHNNQQQYGGGGGGYPDLPPPVSQPAGILGMGSGGAVGPGGGGGGGGLPGANNPYIAAYTQSPGAGGRYMTSPAWQAQPAQY